MCIRDSSAHRARSAPRTCARSASSVSQDGRHHLFGGRMSRGPGRAGSRKGYGGDPLSGRFCVWGRPAGRPRPRRQRMRRSCGGSMKRLLWAPTALALTMLSFVAVPAEAGTKLDTSVAPQSLLAAATAQPGASFRVIVTTTASSPVDANFGQLQNGNGNKFGIVSRTFSVIHGAAAEVTGTQRLSLVDQPGVVSVTPDAPVIQDAVVVPAQVWQDSTGISALPAAASAPAIAVVDSGIATGQAFGNRIAASVDLTTSATPGGNGEGDSYGHGTLVAGIAAGSSGAYPGAAPTARLVSIRVVGSDGSARTSDVLSLIH